MNSDQFAYDFFISRRGSAASEAQFIADTLQAEGYRVFVQDNDIAVGDVFMTRMHEGLKRCRDLIVVLNSEYDQSLFTMLEFAGFASASSPGLGKRLLIILRIEDFQPQGVFAAIVFQDLAGVSDPDERRKRILAAAKGKSQPAPFQVISTRLVDGLRASKDVPDAWHRLMKKMQPFVGREAELRQLMAFANGIEDRRGVTWQVLYGPHACGKSRLAREWLEGLASGSLPWDVGWAPDTADQLLRLLSLRPSRDTAIVIDEAPSYGNALWLFLERAQAWADSKAMVRILLVGHNDLDGPTDASFALSESVKSLRQSRAFDDDEAKIKRRVQRAVGDRVSVKGIKVGPIEDVTEQRALLDAAGREAKRQLGSAERQQVLAQAEGRPALLLLAATHPDDWRDFLDDYARGIAEEAERLFTPSRDGLRVLAAAVLAGPLPDSIRMGIAPEAIPPTKLARLFPGHEADVAREIPRFQPDLLGFQVLAAALAKFSEAEVRLLAQAIHAAQPVRFVQQLRGCFDAIDQAPNYYCLLVERAADAGARFAANLETLVSVLAAAEKIYPDTPADAVTIQRRNAILALLEVSDDWGMDRVNGIVCLALEHASQDGFGPILRSALQDVGLTRNTLGQWLALIGAYTAPMPSPIAEKLSLPAFRQRDPRTAAGCDALVEALQSESCFTRLYASYELADWLHSFYRMDKLDPGGAVRLVAVLEERLAGSTDHELMATAFALKGFIRAGAGDNMLRRHDFSLPSTTLDAVLARIENWLERPGDYHAINQYVQIVCLAHERPGLVFDAFDWLWKVRDLEFPQPPDASVRVVQTLRRLAVRDYQSSRVPEARQLEIARTATLSLVRQGRYTSALREPLELALAKPSLSKTRTRAIVCCCLAGTSGPDAREVLLSLLAASEQRESDLTFVTAFLLVTGQFQVLDDLAPLARSLDKAIDIAALVAEARTRTLGEAWTSADALALRQIVRDAEIRRSGNLIHKLKARDSTKRWAYYFVHVHPSQEEKFMAAIDGSGMIDLEGYGTVIASCYGEKPNEDTVRFLKGRYGFDV